MEGQGRGCTILESDRHYVKGSRRGGRLNQGMLQLNCLLIELVSTLLKESDYCTKEFFSSLGFDLSTIVLIAFNLIKCMSMIFMSNFRIHPTPGNALPGYMTTRT